MSSVYVADLQNFGTSPFPLTPLWDGARHVWHDHYPEYVPPDLSYQPRRTERLLLCSQQEYPERIVLRYFNANWSYTELVNRVQQVAANLQDLGIGPGDRVMAVLPNSPEFVVAWFALHWIGAEIVPTNPLLAGKDLIHLANLTDARAVLGLDLRLTAILDMLRETPLPLLIVTSLAPHLPRYLSWPYRAKNFLQGKIRAGEATRVVQFESLYSPHVSPLQEPLLNDVNLPAVLQPTGGTTGVPKVALLSHANLQANVAQLHAWCGLKPGEEVVLAVLPFFHVFGASVALLSAVAGGSTLILQARFDPKKVLKAIDRWQPGVGPMVPFMFAELSQEMERRGRNVSSLDFCFSGASRLPPDVKEEFQRRTGAQIFEGFGLSEASPVTHANPPNAAARPGTIGLPLPGTIARIVDTDNGERPLPPGEVGELIVKGPQIMQGYLDDDEETDIALRNGWLYTGDLAQMDENGFFTLVDRKKDMIISGGLNVYPTEVEKVIALHDSVEQCAVVGSPCIKYGERLMAYVVPQEGKQINSAELEKHCRQGLASYKVPRTIEVCESLPTNFLGKVRRVELRNRAA